MQGNSRGQWLGRNLLQSATTAVTTAAQLQNAVSTGVRHIVVQQHMDFSSLKLSERESVLGVAADTTLSITVRFWFVTIRPLQAGYIRAIGQNHKVKHCMHTPGQESSATTR